MTITGLDSMTDKVFEDLRVPVQGAMAAKFHEITLQNFGSEGVDRPSVWPPLSSRYAKRVNRSHATLFVTGGLFDSVKLDATNPDAAAVWSDSDYAETHQWGSNRDKDEKNFGCPARPFMPIDESGELTQYAAEQINQAANDAVTRFFQQ